MDENSNNKKSRILPNLMTMIGTGLGAGIGTVLGMAFDSIEIAEPIRAGIGSAILAVIGNIIGAALDRHNKKDN